MARAGRRGYHDLCMAPVSRKVPPACNRELRRILISTQYGAYCRQQQAHVQEGGSMPTRDKRLLTDLRCRKHDHPFKAEIWQRLHYVAHSNEIVGKTTPKGALDNVK